jgi:uncharacterized protein YcbK (DUF882 family)
VAVILFDERLGIRVGTVGLLKPDAKAGLTKGLLPGVSCVMGVQNFGIGQKDKLKKRVTKAVASVAIAGTFMLGAWTLAGGAAISGGETRTISLYHQHTRESISVTYMVNGRYVPSAMKKINYVLRDWRRNQVITIDPRTIDLVWELHADLGSRQPVRIVCGYRSPATNSFLKRIGRRVAKHSQHMKGKAIDFFFADVSLTKIRNSALARGVGGVGFYSGRNGFLHVDSGNVRHWGPGMAPSNMRSLIADGRRYVGNRARNGGGLDTQMIASAEEPAKKSGGILGWIFRPSAPKASPEVIAAAAVAPSAANEEGDGFDDGGLADLSQDASAAALAAAKAKKAVPAAAPDVVAYAEQATPAQIAAAAVVPAKPGISSKANNALAALASSASVESLGEAKPGVKIAAPTPVAADAVMVPKPRIRPAAVVQMAEARVKDVIIAPVSAQPDEQTWAKKKPSQVAEPLSKDVAHALIGEDGTVVAEGKSSLFEGEGIADLKSGETITESPVLATAVEPPTGWLSALFSNANAAANPDGVAPALVGTVAEVMPTAKTLGPDGTVELIDIQRVADGKEDLQTINRDGKGNLEPIRLRLTALKVK